MHELARSVCASPELFPYALDVPNDLLTFIHLDESAYESASFLDARVLTPRTTARTLPWPRVAAAVDEGKLVESCAYIFHIGHVGSTLLSRLVGAHPRLFSIREPALLRLFAQGAHAAGFAPQGSQAFEARLEVCLKLLSRTFHPQQRAVIKATSFVSELAAGLMSRPSAPRAVIMCISPESYLATILGGENSRQEAKQLAPMRLTRLHARIGREAWRLDRLSEGERIAVGWTCEMSALAPAVRAAGARAQALDFDRFLGHPASYLMRTLRHLGVDASSGEVDAILAGPHMHRYSKAPEHAYDARLRGDILQRAWAVHGTEIRRGIDWIESAARSSAVVRDALGCAAAAG